MDFNNSRGHKLKNEKEIPFSSQGVMPSHFFNQVWHMSNILPTDFRLVQQGDGIPLAYGN